MNTGNYGKRLLFNITVEGKPVRINIEFPLENGITIVQGPLTYDADGMATAHSVAWMDDPNFVEAYRRGMATGHRFEANLHIEWRVYLACWAAKLASKLDGDFVECGVNTGIFSAAICSYINFGQFPEKRFYLLDTFAGLPLDQLSPEEVAHGIGDAAGQEYFDTYDLVRETFAEYPNVVLVKGRVPDTLPLVPSSRIAYLCLDMNAAKPERAAMEFFWDKIVPGGMIVLDDYGFQPHSEQQVSLDEFARLHDVSIFTMPTGHGLLIKPR
jgi:O-methyltransferase